MNIRKMNDFDTFKKLPNNVGNLCKIIVATGFEWLPKVHKIAFIWSHCSLAISPSIKMYSLWTVVVSHLSEWSFPTLDARGSNKDTGICLFLNPTPMAFYWEPPMLMDPHPSQQHAGAWTLVSLSLLLTVLK